MPLMKIIDVESTYEVEFDEPRIITCMGERYEVTRTLITVSPIEDGELWYRGSTRGKKLTKAGAYSQSATNAYHIYGPEVDAVEDEAIEIVKAAHEQNLTTVPEV